MKLLVLLILVFSSGCLSTSEDKPSSSVSVSEAPQSIFIGTYTRDEGWVNGQAEGIYRADLSEDGSTLSNKTLVAEVINPSFLAISPDKKHLYAVSELNGNDGSTGYIHAFKIEEDQSLSMIGKVESNGLAPAHISLDSTGTYLFAANYSGGVVTAYERRDDGSLIELQQLKHEGSGPHPNQNASHVHMAKVSPDNQHLYVPDLGSDKVWSYRIDYESNQITKTADDFSPLPEGAGPRHMAFHPNGKFAYSINELNSTVTFFNYQSNGSLNEVQHISTLPKGYDGPNSTADIHVHPNGKYLYASNRGHDSIVAYNIGTGGHLSLMNHTSSSGEYPRNFAIHPSGGYLYAANQNTNTIEVFKINPANGRLVHLENNLAVETPVCIVFF